MAEGMEKLIEIALTNAGSAAVLAGVAVVAERFLRRPRIAHLLWVVVLLRLLMPPLLGVPLLPPQATPAAVTPAVSSRAVAPVPLSTAGQDRRLLSHPSFEGAVVAVWLLGAGAVLWLTVSRGLRFARVLNDAALPDPGLDPIVATIARRMGIQRPPRVRLVDAPVSPMLWAPLRTISLILPSRLLERLEAGERDTLIAHELAHLRRRDHRLRLVEQATVALFWWYPLSWWASRRLRTAEERCCDALVTRSIPDSSRAYAHCLLKTTEYLAATEATEPALAGGAAGAEELKERLTMIIKGYTPRSLSTISRLLMAFAVAAMLAIAPVRAARSDVDAKSGATFVTIDVHDADIKDVFRSLADQSGINITLTPGVEGTATVDLHEVPAAEALELLLELNGLESTTERGIIFVHPAGEAPASSQEFTGEPITLSLKDADIHDVLETFASLVSLNIVVDPGVQGVCTVKFEEVPWDQALDSLIRSNGYTYTLDGNVLRVHLPDPTALYYAAPAKGQWTGEPISINIEGSDIHDVLRQFEQLTGLVIVADDSIQGQVTMELVNVPWDQALDLILRVNGLTWTLDGNTMEVSPAASR